MGMTVATESTRWLCSSPYSHPWINALAEVDTLWTTCTVQSHRIVVSSATVRRALLVSYWGMIWTFKTDMHLESWISLYMSGHCMISTYFVAEKSNLENDWKKASLSRLGETSPREITGLLRHNCIWSFYSHFFSGNGEWLICLQVHFLCWIHSRYSGKVKLCQVNKRNAWTKWRMEINNERQLFSPRTFLKRVSLVF
jgi:hypothetical protein